MDLSSFRQRQRGNAAGKLLTIVLVLGLLGLGGWLVSKDMLKQGGDSPLSSLPSSLGGGVAVPEPAEPVTGTPVLQSAAPYEMKNNIIDIDMSEYAGYGGLIVANGGLAPNPESIFAKQYGFQLRLSKGESEEWSALNNGQMAAVATTADVLAVRGVLEANQQDDDTAPLRALILTDLPGLIADFNAMRAAEGAALQTVIAAQLDRIAALTAQAKAEADTRREASASLLRDALARVLSNAEGVDETRLAQELAMLAVKNDVTEELDRLTAHIAAARDLLAEPGPVGRKFDFLMQEFMREANTLCSKAQALALTRIGLDLKTVIDQMREQVQNVE